MTPIRVCAEPRCPNQAVPGKSRCAIHAAEQRKANRSRFDGFYCSKLWRMARRKQLFDFPVVPVRRRRLRVRPARRFRAPHC